jgi:hypothetical protein
VAPLASALRSYSFRNSPRVLPERRLIAHLSGEVEIGLSDGAKHIFRAGDVRLMEDLTGPGHTHRDLTPTTDFVYLILGD